MSMSSRKRQLFAIEDVVDILLNGRLPDASMNEENAPPPVKRVSLPSNDPVKAAIKLDSKNFYGSPKQTTKVADVPLDSPKCQQLLKKTLLNSPCRTTCLPLGNQPSPLVCFGNSSDSLKTESPIPKRSESADGSLKTETYDSPKSNVAKWSGIFMKPSPRAKQNDGSESKKKQNSFASWLKKTQDRPGETANQTTLDAGQKEFGVVQCKECSMVYELKSPDDELLHMKHHDAFKEALHLSNTTLKNLAPARCIDGGLQIYQATKDSAIQKSLVFKCDAVLEVVNRELKHVTDQPCLEKLTSRQKAYVCVDPVSNRVVGLCIAEPVARGFPTFSTAWPIVLERDPRKSIAGIRLIWVSPEWRRKGIAKALMETVRSTFVYACVLSKREIAISPPTLDAFNFFRSYLGGISQEKPTNESGKFSPTIVFLVYDA